MKCIIILLKMVHSSVCLKWGLEVCLGVGVGNGDWKWGLEVSELKNVEAECMPLFEDLGIIFDRVISCRFHRIIGSTYHRTTVSFLSSH